MNFQTWQGVESPKYGYGSMLTGFRSAVPKTVSLVDDASVSVFMNTPNAPHGFYAGQHRVCFTMWETDTLPAGFVRWLGEYEQILVPCEHNVELFSQFHPDVKMVPLGVDNKFWFGYVEPEGPFKFMAGGSLWFRKGLDVLVKAFQKINIPGTELHIKAAPHAHDTPEVDDPRIVLNRQWMDVETQRDWFRQGHVYVAPSRGEGFGLMPLQMISMGMPTIVSDTTGQKQFSYLATGVISAAKSPAHTIGFWDEPNLDELCELMIDHHRNWSKYQAEAVVNARSSTAFSWAKATKALLGAVPVGQQLESAVWEPAEIKVKIRTRRNLSCDIGNHHYQFKAGVEYEVPEGVFQVLSDAKVLEQV